MIRNIVDNDKKKSISREILETLTEWFGIEESREEYIADTINQKFYVADENNKSIGFLTIKETSKDTIELAVIGVLKEYHRRGIGRQLFEEAIRDAKNKGYSFIQVKTVKKGCYEEYDKTNEFYISLGFKELEVFPTLWDENNPCQIYIMTLK